MAQARSQQLPGALGTLLALPLHILQEFDGILIVGLLGILDVLMIDQSRICRMVERADQVIGHIAGTGNLPQRRSAGATIHASAIHAAIHARAITIAVATTVHTGTIAIAVATTVHAGAITIAVATTVHAGAIAIA